VQDDLERLMVGRTSIVIAHRLSTIRKAEQIFVLDGGSIVEKGTHEELLNLENGLYKNLSKLQYTW
jgi:ABC-type multidrug transport system fused ATPase/permease subunit